MGRLKEAFLDQQESAAPPAVVDPASGPSELSLSDADRVALAREQIALAQTKATEALVCWYRVGGLIAPILNSLPHGSKSNWIRDSLQISRSTAYGCVRVHEYFGPEAESSIVQRVAQIGDTSLRKLIKVISKPRPATEPSPTPGPAPDLPAERPPITGEFERVTDTATEIGRHEDEIRSRMRHIKESARRALNHARTAGENLLKAKALLPDDEWSPWLAENIEFGEAQAILYMRVAQDRDHFESMVDSDPLQFLAELLPLPAFDPAYEYATVEPDGKTLVLIEPSSADGHWNVTRVDNEQGAAEGTRRPVAQAYLAHTLISMGVTSNEWHPSPAQERIARNRWLIGA